MIRVRVRPCFDSTACSQVIVIDTQGSVMNRYELIAIVTEPCHI
jgi:hypothetical protein